MSAVFQQTVVPRTWETTSAAGPWIAAALFPLTALLVVPFTQSWLPAGAGRPAGYLTERFAWNASLFVLGSTLIAATATDLASRRIRNYVTYTAVLWLLALSLAASYFQTPETIRTPGHVLLGTLDFGSTIGGLAVCFGVMFLMFIVAGTGGGDVKLGAVMGAALGPEAGLTAIVVSHIVAGAAALSWISIVHGPISTLSTIGRTVGSVFLPVWIAPPAESEAKWLKFPLPMSPFFLVGTLLTLLLLR